MNINGSYAIVTYAMDGQLFPDRILGHGADKIFFGQLVADETTWVQTGTNTYRYCTKRGHYGNANIEYKEAASESTRP